MTRNPHSPAGHFRRFFLRGLAVVLPATLTLWVLVQAYLWVDRSIAEPINRGIRYGITRLYANWSDLGRITGVQPDESALAELRREDGVAVGDTSLDAALTLQYQIDVINSWWTDFLPVRMIGLVVAIAAVYIAGRLVGGLVGRWAYRNFERFLTSLPVIKKIYAWIKQIVDFLFNNEDKKMKFNRVVAAEYPRRGIWSVGFQTGESMKSIAPRSGNSVTVFIPSSPTPFTGYTVTVPREDIIELPITVEEAIGFAISGGVLRPPAEQITREDQPLPAGPTTDAEEDA